MLLKVDPSASEPLFSQLAGSLRAAIATGGVTDGERLPTAKVLATSLDVNVHTVLRAYQVLRDEGLIELRRGRGAVVSSRAHEWITLHEALKVVVAESNRLGMSHDATTSLLRSALKEEMS